MATDSAKNQQCANVIDNEIDNQVTSNISQDDSNLNLNLMDEAIQDCLESVDFYEKYATETTAMRAVRDCPMTGLANPVPHDYNMPIHAHGEDSEHMTGDRISMGLQRASLLTFGFCRSMELELSVEIPVDIKQFISGIIANSFCAVEVRLQSKSQNMLISRTDWF
mmetsp:Transcript_39896/g.63859  ORF Transcript_39896/g.63859 Transcript_39896/m.63859 type:complete len:166 (-) Transcript_39896:207-704(-)